MVSGPSTASSPARGPTNAARPRASSAPKGFPRPLKSCHASCRVRATVRAATSTGPLDVVIRGSRCTPLAYGCYPVTVSMRVMSSGDGYRYLLKSVAVGDGDRLLSTPLTRYYTEEGTPPGRWLGSGLSSLGEGQLAAGDRVSEAQLQLLIGTGHDPVTVAPLGRPYPVYRAVADRVVDRIAALDPALTGEARTRAEAQIEAEERARGGRRAVAGFDFTFSVPKSASVFWAVAGADTQAAIVEAHHASVAGVLAFMERDLAATRVGISAGDGAVAQVAVSGLIAAAFDHFDSRAGDPHLHTHVVVSNKVNTVMDGRWRSLDGRPLHAATVALSELHEAVFADRLTRALGVGWEQRARGRDRNPGWSIETVTELNRRARADLVLQGCVDASHEVPLHDDTSVSPGDVVVTRRNDRRLRSGRGWVRNGDRWEVTGIRADGAVTIRRPGRRWGGRVVIPPEYVAEHLELGYAVTAHRAQGSTVDTAHALVDPSTTREHLYVALTRGRSSNIAYVATDRPDEAHTTRNPAVAPNATARSVFAGVLRHVGAERSAHDTITAEQQAWGSIAQLAAEYETIAAAAQHDRWATLIQRSGLTDSEAEGAVASEAFGPLTAELRRAEAHHHDFERLLPRLVAARGFDDADDIAAVLRTRLIRATADVTGSGRARRTPRLIVRLIPEAGGPMTAEMAEALQERRRLIEQRGSVLVETARSDREPWVLAMGQEPRDPARASARSGLLRTVAAYRDRYRITGMPPLGGEAITNAQQLDASRARKAIERAHQLASKDGAHAKAVKGHVPRRGGLML